MAFTQREPIGVVIAVSAFNHLAVLGAAWFITADDQESGNPARADQNIPSASRSTSSSRLPRKPRLKDKMIEAVTAQRAPSDLPGTSEPPCSATCSGTKAGFR